MLAEWARPRPWLERVDEDARVVTIVRVIHGSQDFGPDDFEDDSTS